MKYKMIMILCIAGILAMGASAYADKPEEQITTAHVDGRVYDIDTNEPIGGVNVTAFCESDTKTTRTHVNGGNEGEFQMELKCPFESTVTVVVHVSGNPTATGVVKQAGVSNVGQVYFNIGVDSTSSPALPEYPIGIMPAMMTVLGIGLAGRKF